MSDVSTDMVWIPLESNPDVMNVFLHELGVPKKVQVVDVYSLDPEMLALVPQPALALLLLFPCDDKYEQHKSQQEKEIRERGQEISSKLYFLKQYVHNACGTIALIHSIANLDSIELGDGHLKQFLDDSKNLSPEKRGELLQKCEGIINTHKDVASTGQTAPPDLYEPVPYHFVAFVHKDGCLYELDGRKEFPVNHGKSSEETFLHDAAEVCRTYMSRNPENVNFTVVAITAE
ncbi:UNVERIFIED_CONTAM: hypothetical protein PYX00_001601 [Menopon gallinae]|uniref:Ubiquitin carboxyl-terminal hydrolase n=1 Tax=Menopon gallinae TaxID=328185 RepID=A0AAW2IDF5_9NEOP